METRKLAAGILAHVDAGKTTLSEGMLYVSGRIKKLGRVDHQDAFLDTYALERERGITIFSKQAILPLDGLELTLLDTPGHVDFSAEMERTLRVLDYAILVISGSDGVQGHTMTLWRLLERYGVPVFLFINKMDLAGTDPAALLRELKRRLGEGCVDFSSQADFAENVALCDEALLERYLDSGAVTDGDVQDLVARRRLFPCYFGSALKLDGVEDFLAGLARYTRAHPCPAEFGARVYKIARDPQGARLTYLKVTGGSLRVKALLTNRRASLTGEPVWEEKVDQIRLYSGAKYETVESAGAGTVCAVTGLSHTYPGEGLGWERAPESPLLEPVLHYRVILPPQCDPHSALLKLRQLQEEDPQLHIVWNEQLGEIHLQLMGEVQLDILRQLIAQRFGLDVSFGSGGIVYRETIAAPVEGVGHFEPLRHYAEVHLLLEPDERGSGLRFESDCGEDVLPRAWQRLILTHLEEKVHLGVLTGSPITDMVITLTAGRGHEKHTEGGDFREATYRAVRQGLMQAQSVLLEPWYAFRLEVPGQCVGRAMADLQRMNAQAGPPELSGDSAVLTGTGSVAALRGYAHQVASYTKGLGRLFCTSGGYAPCPEQDAVVEAIGYAPERDLANTPDSVFCAHGAGYVVPWDQVHAYMHVQSGRPTETDAPAPPEGPPARPARAPSYSGSLAQDKELQAIYERTYGPVKPRAMAPAPTPRQEAVREAGARQGQPREEGPEYLLVDGYNIIFAWDELKAVARDNLDAARQLLMDLLSSYQGYRKCEVILVFDAYRVPRSTGEVVHYHNIHVVFTREAETADAYIEKATLALAKKHRVRVATSDGPEQLIILGHGALRLSATAFRTEVEQVQGQIAAAIARNNRTPRSYPLRDALRRAQEPP